MEGSARRVLTLFILYYFLFVFLAQPNKEQRYLRGVATNQKKMFSLFNQPRSQQSSYIRSPPTNDAHIFQQNLFISIRET